MTVAAYIITLLLVFTTMTTLLQSIIGGFFVRLTGLSFDIGAFVGALITWILINLLWVGVEGDSIPIIILIISLLFLLIHHSVSKFSLNEFARRNMYAEFWAILLLGLYLIISSNTIRWF